MAVGQRQNLWGEEAGIQHEAPARLRGALGQQESAQLGRWGLQSPSGPTSSLKGRGVRTGSHWGWGLVSETLALQGPPQRAQSVHTILHGQGACSALRVACPAECLEKDVLIR